MDDLGKYLQAERKKQKVSIDEIASHTKIPIRFIQAMEANQFDLLPNAVSAKGFLRGYAQFLDLDTVEISEAFDESLSPAKKGGSSHEKQDEILSYLQVKRSSRLPFPRRVIFLVGGVILLLLIFVGFLPERKNSQRTPSAPPLAEQQLTSDEDKPAETEILIAETKTAESAETSPAPAEEISSTPSEQSPSQKDVAVANKAVEDKKAKSKKLESKKKVAATQVSPEKKETPAPESPSENETQTVSQQETPRIHLLYVEAIEPTWVQVKIDGDEVREALLQPNDSIRWKAKEKFLLKVGNAGGVKVRLNGKELDSLGPSGEVVEKEIIGVIEKTE